MKDLYKGNFYWLPNNKIIHQSGAMFDFCFDNDIDAKFIGTGTLPDIEPLAGAGTMQQVEGIIFNWEY